MRRFALSWSWLHRQPVDEDELMSAVDIKQLDTFKAATLFAQAEGIIPAPESSHAIAAAIHEAEQAKIEGKPRTILFNLSGHGLIDMAAYDQYLSGDLTNYEVTDEEVANNLKGFGENHLIKKQEKGRYQIAPFPYLSMKVLI